MKLLKFILLILFMGLMEAIPFGHFVNLAIGFVALWNLVSD